jgi:hypothetical protein
MRPLRTTPRFGNESGLISTVSPLPGKLWQGAWPGCKISRNISMNTDFKVGDVVRHKSDGRDTIIIRLEDETVDGVTKKLAVCGRFEGQNFHQETIPVEMLEFVNRWLAAGS